ncbi:MAG: M1 family aminopeptidase [Deltaproteobacteria bacterium]|nr:M1 family aminopeptidase [Deltaproteobacteria bacterium]
MSTSVHRHRERCGCHGAQRFPVDPSAGPRPFRLAGDPERFGRARAFAIEHLRVELAFDLAARAIEATATLTIKRRDPAATTLSLDAVGFELHAVTHGDKRAIAHRYDGDQLHLTLPLSESDWTVAVRYRVTPQRGLYLLFPNENRPTRPVQVWSQCQDEDARYWIPCHDYPNMRMRTEFVIDAPQGWHVLSNGKLIARTKIPGKHGMDAAAIGASGPGLERWHWRQDDPHVAYLMTLVAGKFAELNADMADLSVRYYVEPGREADGQRAFGRTPEMIAHFEKLFGVKFPWAKYHQITVHDFVFGGMENTSATTMTDRILLDERAALDNTADDIVAHELAHQWFGDLVTCRDWSHAWLNEGFATFCEHLDAELKGGVDEYRYSLEEHAQGYFGEDSGRYRRPIVCSTYANPIDLFDRHLYEKGGWVLHMLRKQLGDALFFGGVQSYLQKHGGTIVETRDLLRALEEQSGRSLEGFFDQWVYKAGHPELEISVEYDDDKALLSVRVKQAQKVDAVTPLFVFDLEIAVVTDAGEQRHTLHIDGAEHLFVLASAGAPKHVAVDPEGAVLAKFTQQMSRDFALHALRNDPRAVVRWRAAQALTKREEPAVIEALARAVREDAFWGASAEVASVLGEQRSARARDALIALLDVPHPKVRRAVVAALGSHPSETTARALLPRLAKGDPSVLVEAELARSLGKSRQNALAYEPLLKALSRDSWRDVVRAGAIDGLAKLREPKAIAHIEPFAARSASLGTRRIAVQAIAQLAYRDPAVRERLELLIDTNDPYFTPELFRALVTLGDPGACGAIAHARDQSIDGRVQRHAREALTALRADGGPAEEVRKLRDQVEQMEQRARKLEDAMTNLVARLDRKKPESAKKPVAKKPVAKKPVAKKPAAKKKR